MQLTYKQLNETGLFFALNNLASMRMADTKLAYHVGKLLRQVESAYKVARTEYLTLAKKYAKLDEAGAIVEDKSTDTGFQFRDEEAKKAYETDYAKFAAKSATITLRKITINELSGARVELSARELSSLDPLLTEIGMAEELASVTPVPTSTETGSSA